MSKSKETRRYSKQDDLQEVERYRTMYPWYRKLMDDVHELFAARDKHCGDYSYRPAQRRTTHNNA